MNQLRISDAEYAGKKSKTRREKFLEKIDTLIPCQSLETLIEPHYPKPGNCRRP